jgi:hypothetical protein
MTKKQFLDLSLEEQVNAWNEFSFENGFYGFIYENNETTLQNVSNSSFLKLAYLIHYGSYSYNDTYIYFDDLGRLLSFSDELTLRGIIDIDEMLKWYNENKKEI